MLWKHFQDCPADRKTGMAFIDKFSLWREAQLLDQASGALPVQGTADGMAAGVIIPQDLSQRLLPEITDAEALADLDLAVGIDMDPGRGGQVLIGAFPELLPGAGRQTLRECVCCPPAKTGSTADDRLSLFETALSFYPGGIDADWKGNQSQLVANAPGDPGGSLLLVAEMELIITDGKHLQSSLGQGFQQQPRLLLGQRSVGIGDDTYFKSVSCGPADAFQQQGIVEGGFTALEIYHFDCSGPQRLLEDCIHLLDGEGPGRSGTAVQETVVAFEVAAVSQQEVDF